MNDSIVFYANIPQSVEFPNQNKQNGRSNGFSERFFDVVKGLYERQIHACDCMVSDESTFGNSILHKCT